ncbi:MAG TPA: hypothetical protein PLS90_06400 [Candidatus Sumerlaeota bacterium]|nr:hypothetical protein [Candidatus Sumerlaeota bacterium]HPK02070.1 hypothetical protein [Candidatus Sumerlaeota bacterium]
MKLPLPRLSLAVLALLLLAPGCRQRPYLETVFQTPYLGFPGGLDNLLRLDVNRLRGRDWYRETLREARQSPRWGLVIQGFTEQVQYQPWQEIDELYVGIRGEVTADQPFRNAVFIARGRFERPAETLERLRLWLGQEFLIDPPPFRQSTYGDGWPVFQTSGQSQYRESVVHELSFAFPTLPAAGDNAPPPPTLMVFGLNRGLFNDTLAVMAGEVDGLQKDAEWLALLQRPNIGALAWGTGRTHNLKFAAVRELLGRAQAYFFHLDFESSNLKAEVGLVSGSIDQAQALTDLAQQKQQLLVAAWQPIAPVAPALAEVPGKLFIITEAETTSIRVSLTHLEWRAVRDDFKRIRSTTQSLPLPPL